MKIGLIFILVSLFAYSGSFISKSNVTKTYSDTVTTCLELTYLNGTSYHLIQCSKNDTFEHLVDLNDSAYGFVTQYCENEDNQKLVIFSKSLIQLPLKEEKNICVNKNESSFLVKDSVEFADKLIGLWTISVDILNGIKGVCNSCPIVDFIDHGIAKIKFPTARIEEFKWLVIGDSLFFTYLQDSSRIFQQDRYQMRFERKKDFEELELKINYGNNIQIYVLRKDY